MNINAKRAVVLLIPIIIFTSISSVLLSVRGAPPSSIIYSYGLETYSIEIVDVWNGESFIVNESGSNNGTFNYTFGYKNDSYWIEEERTVTYTADYSFFQNTTLTGNNTLSMDIDMYTINVSYGDVINLVWMAMKNGTMTWERYETNTSKSYDFSVNSSKTTDITYKKYDLATHTILLDEWNDSVITPEVWSENATVPWYDDTKIERWRYDVEYSMPLIMLFQIYTTSEGEKVAWSEMLGEMVVYDDKDKNAIYSAAEGIATNSFNYYTSDEYIGWLYPEAINEKVLFEIIDVDEPWKTMNDTSNILYPVDKSIEEFADNIEFTSPSKQGNIVSWDIKYPDFPIYPSFGSVSSLTNATYADTSPGNFSYGFEYDIKSTEADLSLTIALPKITNSTLYNAVQGYGLAMPHYTYFVSSTDIEKDQDLIITVPNNRFKFLANGSEIARISMSDPNKTAYTLFDYPTVGEQSEYDAIGSTVSNMIINSFENDPLAYKQLFADVVFSLDSYVLRDPEFNVSDSLFSIETQNYPVWSGEKLVHDPVFTAYYEEGPSLIDDDGVQAVGGFPMGILVGIGGTMIGIVGVRLVFKKKHK